MTELNNITNTRSVCHAQFFPYRERNMDIGSIATSIIGSLGGSASFKAPLNQISNIAINKTLNAVKTPANSKTNILSDISNTANNILNIMDSDTFIETDSIISCTTSRSKSNHLSEFQITLKSDKNFYNMAKPGDWVIIFMGNENEVNIASLSGIKEIGIIDRVSSNAVTMGNGAVSHNILIHGTGFGKVLEKTQMYYNPFLIQAVATLALKTFGMLKTGNPVDFVNFYLDIFLGDATKQGIDSFLFQMLVPPALYSTLKGSVRSKGSDVSFNDLLTRQFSYNAAEGYSLGRDISHDFTGSLWNTIKQASNEAINEMFLDIRNSRPTLIFRKIPLTKTDLIFLMQETIYNPKYHIYLKNIINHDLGTSDHEIGNYIVLLPVEGLNQHRLMAFAANYPKEFPQINKESIKRYGFRLVEAQTEYGFTKGSNGADIDKPIIQRWNNELAQYWNNYWRSENGTIEIMGKTDFEIGQFYYLPEKNMCYMVESIESSWQFGSSIITTLTVSHGYTGSGGYVDENTGTDLDYGTGKFIRE